MVRPDGGGIQPGDKAKAEELTASLASSVQPASVSSQDAADTATVNLSQISDKLCDNVIRHVSFLP